MDSIIIRGLAVDTLIGVYAWERERLTTLLLDITIDCDLSAAVASDAVADTIDYAAVAERVRHIGKHASYDLLEALAGALFRDLFLHFPATQIQLEITKPDILPQAKQVAVRLTRSRSQVIN